ncbi:GntR family transcriptional regulator [Nakamurella leprariae]|uniref:GntR family transcriptional regulator n=1 Tax=Nakamurella leprariae TaxID=2803911 RepID=A0A938YDL8_9ACTN|nr:GntR family transcriptional regulator [Nakamurella leprariae]MBM9468752.1 GntR family transcriptional regulator [Nakamurella leprariae]
MAKAAETAYAFVRSAVLSGRFARGERLREAQLAELVGVSRTPVREALRRLDSEGLVEFTPNVGARVTAWSPEELTDLYEMRSMLEGYGARLAAERIGDRDLDHLADLAARMEALSNRGTPPADEMTVLNGEFHRAIVQGSRNAQLASLVRGMMEVPLITRTFQRYSPPRMRASTMHHNELVEAIRARDGMWAESVMRTHILAARNTVLESAADPDTVDDPPVVEEPSTPDPAVRATARRPRRPAAG